MMVNSGGLSLAAIINLSKVLHHPICMLRHKPGVRIVGVTEEL